MIQAAFRKRLHGAQGDFQLDVDLHIQSGEILALYGASGAGKTTLLRCLAGLDQPDSGLIQSGDQVWFSHQTGVTLPVPQRRVGLMFQDYALFPNMTVRGNVEFALRRGSDKARVDALLAMMGLEALQQRKPETLSGGQKQRLALARTLAAEPQLLLLDEPLSALDQATRGRLQDEILRLQQSQGLTMIIVSHDVGEIYKMAQRVCQLAHGRISQTGTPLTVFGRGLDQDRFQMTGQVLAIETRLAQSVLTVLAADQIVRVKATPQQSSTLQVGNHVLLTAPAFKPQLLKLEKE